jgi:hypothetical protein
MAADLPVHPSSGTTPSMMTTTTRWRMQVTTMATTTMRSMAAIIAHNQCCTVQDLAIGKANIIIHTQDMYNRYIENWLANFLLFKNIELRAERQLGHY